MQDSNLQPSPCKGDALPIELIVLFTSFRINFLFTLKFRKAVRSVRTAGFEPTCLAALPPQGSASANFATSANITLLAFLL